MRAADIVEELPTVGVGDDALSAVRMVAQQGLPGLVVADEQGNVATCLSPIDLLRLVLPRYLRGERLLARVVDERHADLVAAVLAGTPVWAGADEVATPVPVVRAQATVVELSEVMIRERCPLVMVELPQAGKFGVVTVHTLLASLVAATEGSGSR